MSGVTRPYGGGAEHLPVLAGVDPGPGASPDGAGARRVRRR